MSDCPQLSSDTATGDDEDQHSPQFKMSTSNPIANWDRVGNSFYRKIQAYEAVFDEDLELESYVVAGAPYSGALALYKGNNDGQLQRLRIASIPSSIDIYSYSGKLINRINWDQGQIAGLGWSEDERMIVVNEEGTVRCYEGLFGDFSPFSLGSVAEAHGVISCKFWSTGFVALLGNNQLVSVTNYKEPRPKLLASGPEGMIHSWSIIPPAHTLSRSVEAVLAIDQTVYIVDATEAEDRVLQNGPFKHLSVSPNGRFVAMFTEDGLLWVVSSDFQNKYSEYDSKSRTVPQRVEWCGNDAVILAWEDEVHLVGPNGAATKHFYDGQVHVIPDIDGIKLVTNDSCEFFQKVPGVTEEIFRLGSSSPASVLLDSIELLDQKSPKADENIQRIRPNLAEAVDTCVKAAGQEFNVHWQKQLLRAASFGKSVLDLYHSDDFVEMCEKLRILNAVRDYQIGLPISYEQYLRLTPERLVQRLIDRREYLLAIRISDYLNLSADKIYVSWASQKVKVSTADDNAVCAMVVQRLAGKRGVSFETIARAAYDEGRSHLATQLLNHEPRGGKQVPLLLDMEEDEIALEKAIESGDTDLIFYVLLHLKKKLPLTSFFRLINNKPVASALVEASAKAQDTELLKDMFYQDDRPVDSSNLLISEALQQTELQLKTDKLKLAARPLTDSKDPNVLLHQKAIAEATQLLKMQEVFDKDIDDGEQYTGLSVNQTIFKLIRSGYGKRALKVQSGFKVPDNIFWWTRLRALVAKRDWGELEETVRAKKSPIGWEPFYNEILGAGNSKLAAAFIPKCTHLPVKERIEMWVKCGLPAKAGEEALKAKDLGTLESLRSQASGPAATEIERMINQLRPRR